MSRKIKLAAVETSAAPVPIKNFTPIRRDARARLQFLTGLQEQIGLLAKIHAKEQKKLLAELALQTSSLRRRVATAAS